MMEDQLQELVSDCLIQEQGFADWKTPGQHRVPAPNPGRLFCSSPSSMLAFASQRLLFSIVFSNILGFA
jgi:hypothetical protein